MLFLTDDNDFRGDAQEITIDVSFPALRLSPCRWLCSHTQTVASIWQKANCALLTCRKSRRRHPKPGDVAACDDISVFHCSVRY